MRARRLLFAMTPALLLGLVSPAAAGGWDSLHLREDHYLVGEVAATTDEFYAGELEDSGPIDGRAYHAYLLPLSVTEPYGFGMIDAPNIPEGSIDLGTLEISGPYERAGYVGRYARASLAFTVPDVPTGRYAIGFCDDPCEHGYVGWLAWAPITIVHTAVEGELLASLDRERLDETRLQARLHRSRRAAGDLANRLDEVRASRRFDRVQEDTPSERIVAVPTAPDEGPSGLGWWVAPLGVAAGLAAGLVLGARRRRAPAIVVPDTVPDDLERLERVP